MQAAIVYDLFHVVAKYGREVIDRVRVDQTNKIARAAGPGAVRALRRPLKGSRWLLLKNKRNLAREDRVRLGELLAANRPLFIAYVLKDELKHLWQYRAPHAALRFWREWRRRALASRVEPLVRSVGSSKAISRGSWRIADSPSTPGSSKASTTRSRS